VADRVEEFGSLDGCDPYDLLGVTPDAGPADIRVAYRRAMRDGAHPDRGGTEASAKLINAAYSVLSQRREAFDAWKRARNDSASAPPFFRDEYGWDSAPDDSSIWDDAQAGAAHGTGGNAWYVPPPGYTSVIDDTEVPWPPAPGPTPYPTPGYPPSGYAPPGYPPSGYAPPGYPPSGYAPPGYPPSGGNRHPRAVSGWAIAALVCSVLCALPGFFVSLYALRRVNRDGTRGRWLVIVALMINCLWLASMLGLLSFS
jgi:hypothetical protein